MVNLTISEKAGDKISVNPNDIIKIKADIGEIATIEDINTGKKTVGVISVETFNPVPSLTSFTILTRSLGAFGDVMADMHTL